MASTRTTMEALLKEFYLPALRRVLNDKTFLLAQVEKGSDKVEGLEVVQSIRIGRHQGIGARAEGGTLPTAGNSKVKNVRSRLAYNYGVIELSGPLLRSAATDRGSFARPLETETKAIVTDLKKDVNRQLFGDGTGAIAQCGTTTTSVTVVVGALSATQLRQLVPGMVIDIGPLSGSMIATSRTIQSVTSTTVVIDGATISTTSSHYIFRAGSRDNEVIGLKSMVAASGAYFGLNPSTAGEEHWKATDLNNSGTGRYPAERLFEQAWQDVELASGDQIDLWITTSGVHRQVARQLQSLKRFPGTNELKGGYTGLDISQAGQGGTSATVSMVYDADCQEGLAYGLTTSRMQWQRASDWEFMDEDGAILSRVSGQDAYNAVLFTYAQLVTDNRAAHAIVKDLSLTADPA